MSSSPSNRLSARGLTAALAVAQAHGLQCREPLVLADRSNLLVHLRPAPVVARVATNTALLRQGGLPWLRREVAMAEFLVQRGAPVVAPSDQLPPGPHQHDGLAVSFWRYIDHDPGYTPTAVEVVPLLAELHQVLREYPGQLPFLEPVLGEVPRGLDSLERSGDLEAVDLEMLRAISTRLGAALQQSSGTVQPLHGDAHRHNVLLTGKGLIWNDFEDCCQGPIAWDLATLIRTAPDGEAALAAYDNAPSRETLQTFLDARLLQATVWISLLARYFPQDRPRSQELVRQWRNRETGIGAI